MVDADNPTVKDRDYILKNITNINDIQRLFGFNPENIEFNNSLSFSPPQYMETEKYGIIFTSKGGSSYITKTLTDYALFTDDSSEFNNIFNSTLYPSNSKQSTSKKYNEFFSIINGTSKKDLIIVTRNPLYKWLSGVYQEIEMEYSNSNILYGMTQDEYKPNNNNSDKLTKDLLEKLVYKYLIGTLYREGNITIGHMALYNQVFFLFLLNNNIDTNKLKIIDIDDYESSINKLFNLYNPEILIDDTQGLWTHRTKHEHILRGLDLSVNNSINIKEMVKREVGIDFYYYSLLNKKFDKNFVKNNITL